MVWKGGQVGEHLRRDKMSDTDVASTYIVTFTSLNKTKTKLNIRQKKVKFF